MKRILSLICCLSVMASAFAGCGSKPAESTSSAQASPSSAPADSQAAPEEEAPAESAAGGEITVMVPPWAEPSQELLDSFTAESGIKVVMNIVGWDDIRNKISIAAVGQTAPANVVEVDWSWVGEFGATGWMEPIEMPQEEKDGMPTVQSFIYGDEVLALPYANDFRLAYYNTEHFSQAGVDAAPQNWDETIAACKKIKEAGICEYPLSFTLSATEAATTSLLWMTLSKYGDFFNDDFSVNKDNVLGALTFLNSLVNEEKLIDPASQNMKDIEVYGKLTAGAASFMVGPTYFIGLINNPEESQVVGKAAATLVPGNGTIKTATFALPEGVGIPKYSENKEAARKFIDWYTSPDIQVKMYGEKGNIPTRTVALQQLIDNGTIEGGDVLIEQSDYISAPFPGGIPEWYPEMSNTIYNSVNQMVQGALTPEQAYENIASRVEELRQ